MKNVGKNIGTEIYLNILSKITYSTQNHVYWKLMNKNLNRHLIIECIKTYCQ